MMEECIKNNYTRLQLGIYEFLTSLNTNWSLYLKIHTKSDLLKSAKQIIVVAKRSFTFEKLSFGQMFGEISNCTTFKPCSFLTLQYRIVPKRKCYGKVLSRYGDCSCSISNTSYRALLRLGMLQVVERDLAVGDKRCY